MKQADDEGLGSVLDALTDEFAGVFARESIASLLADSRQRLELARVRNYLPLLAHRLTRERLLAAARVSTPPSERNPMVLFVCTHNAGRSQMAAALLHKMAAEPVQIASAGTQPATELHPNVVTVLDELHLPTGDLFPKPLTDEVVNGADVVITMGCGDTCPVIPGRRYLDWDVADPAGADLETVRSIRNDIEQRLILLLTELQVPARASH